MEEDSGRSISTTGFLRRGSSVSLKDQGNEERPNKTKLNPMNARWADSKEKPRYLREPFRSSGTKAACPSSSKAPVRKYFEEKQGRTFLGEADNAESSSRRTEANRLQCSKKAVVEEDVHPYGQQDEPEDLLSTSTTEDQPAELDPELLDSSVSSGVSAHAIGSVVRNAALRSKSRQQKGKEELCQIRPQTASAFVNRSTIPRNSTNGVKSSNAAGPGVQRRTLKNLGCTSISDVLPSGCSSANSIHNKRAEVMRNRAFDGESSSRPRGLNGHSSLGHSPAMYSGITGPRVRTAEQSASQQTRTSSRSIQESADSSRIRRPSTQHARVRVPNEREDSVFALRETLARDRQPEWAHFSLGEAAPRRSMRPFSMELPHEIYSSSRQGSSNQTARSRSSYRPDESPPQMFHGLLVERENYRRINMEGIAEVLLALDRIEQDDELTYEQLLVLETNLFLSGLGLHDQHRDMRMDIDNMSYEELLALEERIGSVSTALSDEQLVKCLKRNVYKLPNSDLEANRAVLDDAKCSICQEEYIEGEEVGRMQCEHQYHVSCIHEWLRQKNWCPICKTSAIPSEMDKGGT
ncbi:uncharacterized protein [Oryza sativa Japonica Group]|uniref:RING-type E3 ubiquitin transferase n=2 Tax=Oryza sativa subsp. japonica TaxID=39947 RepID=B9FQN8_ORYSJ|nr:uncharacterized protein LOC4341936 [Oryza sativa Japonica Group]KAB8103674.1 hypothetical protein EE612_036242 [Oryza sativa]EEE66280.1 hypothetical protein OsJ_22486 [Oryza sativa Japonica Group]KAF2928269.1 hypothetical protein DAI22_06g266000 [Oryza sativa Japonica Group]USH99841.1 zinc finger protein [Oryza sativa Japonica Group]BAD53902.1 putative DNA binding zinc finger protein [Oryza sativa Japonica Group]|eukprot:NP_001058451.1 Os06g0695600 [Oryza sativa Japonica Group]